MVNVEIHEAATGKLIVDVPIQAQFDYVPGDAQFYDLAWQAAVDDNLVKADERGKYSFTLFR